MKYYRFTLLIVFLIVIEFNIKSQALENTGFWKWTTWTILQGVPSVNYFEDKDANHKGFKFGLEWQIIPLSYSFNANKYVSPVQFFFVKPVKRFSGSVELYFQPELIPGGFEYSGINKFMYKTGIRIIYPVAHSGEYLALSVGGGVQYYKLHDEQFYHPTIEASVYSFYGMIGLKYNYTFNSPVKHSFGMYFKYY